MKGTTKVFWCLAILVAFSVTLLAKVNVDWDKSADFTKYKTYAWGKGTPVKNQLMDQRIIDAVDKQLSAKGMQKTDDPANADLIVISGHAAVGREDANLHVGHWRIWMGLAVERWDVNYDSE